MEDLHGRVALVTGGSRGIGAAVAIRLAEAGVDVAIGYRREQAAAEQVIDAIQGLGRRAAAIQADLGDPAQVVSVVDKAEQQLGPIDMLVSNAAIAPRQALDEITVVDWDRVIDQNLRPAFFLAQRVIPGMRSRGWGRVILISSVAAYTGGGVGPHYATSKAGLIGLMHALAAPLVRQGVTVNAIAPALVEGTGTLPGGPAEQRRTAERVPVGRLGRVEEIADMVLTVVATPYITNQTISVDGGVYPR